MSEDKKVGYVVNFIMDYGSGRQVQITGNLPLGATKEEFDSEFDKIRRATDRQKAFMILQDCEAKLNAERKMVTSLEVIIAEGEKGADEAIKEAEERPNKNHTIAKNQRDSMREQFRNWKQSKTEEMNRHKTNAEIAEVTIASVKKEIEG